VSDVGTIERVLVRRLVADFADVFGADGVPEWVSRPSAHYLTVPRHGQEATLVEIHTSTGLVGLGEAYGLPSSAVSHAAIVHVLAPMIIGRDAADIAGIWADSYAVLRSHGHTHGPYLEGLAGIDIALWDLAGRAAGRPLRQLLGAPAGVRLVGYAGSVPFRATEAQSAEHALGFVAEGFTGIKIKVGRRPDAEARHVASIRDAVGLQVRLMLDANGMYSVADAIRLARLTEPHDIDWFEEPVAVGDVAGLAEVRRRIGQRVASGECEFTAYGVAELLRHRAIDVLIPNITRLGGVSELRRAAGLCELDGVEVSPHGVGTAVGLAAAVHVSSATPAFGRFEVNRLVNPLRDDLPVRSPMALHDSALVPLDGPGLGIEIDPVALARYEVGPPLEVSATRRGAACLPQNSPA
jgi:D-arabinonate dehydratase/D-galactarolactone cycloisomerase